MANGDCVELKGRQVTKTATHYLYQGQSVAATVASSGVPVVGAALATPDYTVTDVACLYAQVHHDDVSEPGRVLFRWQARQPITRAASYA